MTILEAIQSLPEPHRSKALKYQFDQRRPNQPDKDWNKNYDDKVSKQILIGYAFYWKGTDEGDTYWRELWLTLGEY